MDDPLILRTANAVCRKESWTNFLAKKKKRKLLFRTNQKSWDYYLLCEQKNNKAWKYLSHFKQLVTIMASNTLVVNMKIAIYETYM